MYASYNSTAQEDYTKKKIQSTVMLESPNTLREQPSCNVHFRLFGLCAEDGSNISLERKFQSSQINNHIFFK